MTSWILPAAYAVFGLAILAFVLREAWWWWKTSREIRKRLDLLERVVDPKHPLEQRAAHLVQLAVERERRPAGRQRFGRRR